MAQFRFPCAPLSGRNTPHCAAISKKARFHAGSRIRSVLVDRSGAQTVRGNLPSTLRHKSGQHIEDAEVQDQAQSGQQQG